nr:unnamed protein product [Spirometra erinaceieuropaei]
MVATAPLSETRFPEQGQLEEVGAGCTFFWSGCPKVDLRDTDAALEVQNDICLRLPLPAATSSNEAKTKFYEDLQALLASVRTAGKLVVLGDFSARIETLCRLEVSAACPRNHRLHRQRSAPANLRRIPHPSDQHLPPADAEGDPGCTPKRDAGSCWEHRLREVQDV